MSTQRSLAMLAAAGWFVAIVAPVAAAPQHVTDAPGITVDIGDATLMHRIPVSYPEPALAQKIEGTVAVEATLNAAGSVADAHVVAGPEELRRAALESVLEWHFAPDAAGSVRQIRITFQAPPAGSPTRASAPAHSAQAVVPHAPAAPVQGTLKSITVAGLSDPARTELLARLPVHEGDSITLAEVAPRIVEAVKQFDEHLTVSLAKSPGDDFVLRIAAPGAALAHVQPATHSGQPGPIKVGGSVQQTMLVSQARPSYPADAKAAGVQGLVRMQAVINKDGTIKSLEVLEGHPMLVSAALDAVKQWVYRPTLLNGNPVEVITQIDVNFTLAK